MVHGGKDATKGFNVIVFPKCMAHDFNKVVTSLLRNTSQFYLPL